ncbi:MAG: hypothetical protein R3232_12040 [Clostridia bacterium]|nr:hypothetical protein [Clostridia bacterium]
MKKKLIIIITLVVVLALGGTLVVAAVDEDGNWTNPFANILSGKVEEGAITQEEADTFVKVWEAIKGDMVKPEGMKGMGGRKKGALAEGWSEIDVEFLKEYKTIMQAKTQEVLGGLVESGVIDEEALEGGKQAIWSKDMDEETLAAIKEAMASVKVYMDEYLDGKVADGTITQEEADMFNERGIDRMGKAGGRKMPQGRRPCETEE